MADRLPRLRKAPTLREAAAKQTEAEQKPEQPKRNLFGFLKPLWRLLGLFLWPFKKVLRLLVPRYFFNSWRELKQVTWPSRRETWRLTLAVFIFAIVFGALVYVVDIGLNAAFKEFILG